MTINTSYDFITFAGINFNAIYPYAAFNIWKSNKIIDMHYIILGTDDN